MFVKTQKVTIVRDTKTKIVCTVPAYELPILAVVHGEENVKKLEEKTAPRELDETVEVDRLVSRYGQEAVQAAYGKLYASKIADAMKTEAIAAVSKKSDKA